MNANNSNQFFMIASYVINGMLWACPHLPRPRIDVVANALSDWETYFLVLNAINWMAKLTSYEDYDISQGWYWLKSSMLSRALESEEYIHGLWYREGIVYYEGLQYQVSFHLWGDEAIDAWEESDYRREGDGYKWSEIEVQEVGLEILSDLFASQCSLGNS